MIFCFPADEEFPKPPPFLEIPAGESNQKIMRPIAAAGVFRLRNPYWPASV